MSLFLWIMQTLINANLNFATFDFIKFNTMAIAWLPYYILNIDQWTWALKLCGYCVAAGKRILLLTCDDAHPIMSPQIYFSWFHGLSWCYLHPTSVFISCSPATRACIGVGPHAAQVPSGASVVYVIGCVLSSVQSQLSCPQSLGAYAAWARTNRLCAAQAGLVWLKPVHAGSTPVEAVTCYHADWTIYLLSCSLLDF